MPTHSVADVAFTEAADEAADVAASAADGDGDARLAPLLHLQAAQHKQEMERLMRLHPVTNAAVSVRRSLEDLIRHHLRSAQILSDSIQEQAGEEISEDSRVDPIASNGQPAPTSRRLRRGELLDHLEQWSGLSHHQAALMSSVRDDFFLATEPRESELLTPPGLPPPLAPPPGVQGTGGVRGSGNGGGGVGERVGVGVRVGVGGGQGGANEGEGVRRMVELWQGRLPFAAGTGGRQTAAEGNSSPEPPSGPREEVGSLAERRVVSGMARSFRDQLEMILRVGGGAGRPQGGRAGGGMEEEERVGRRQRGDSELEDLLTRRSVSTALASDFRRRLDTFILRRTLELQTHPPPTPSTLDPADHPLPSRAPPPPPPPLGALGGGRMGEGRFWMDFVGRSGAAEWEGVAEMRAVQERMGRLEQLVANVAEMVGEVQRSVRQEVAGAMTRLYEDRGGESVDGSRWAPVRVGICCICCDRSIDALLYRCGHMCTCQNCAFELKSRLATCPMCRAPVLEVVRAYTVA